MSANRPPSPAHRPQLSWKVLSCALGSCSSRFATRLPEAAVVAKPDPDRGSVVRAVLVRAPDAPDETTLNARLQAAVKEQVGRHAYPRVIDYADSLPRTSTGKLRRTELR